MPQSTVVVIPCFNEASRLEVAAFQRFLSDIPEVDLLFVNDGSTDGTLAMLHSFALRCPGRVQVLNLPQNSGKAEAVRQGVLLSLERCPRQVGFLDADLATPLDAVPALIDVLNRLPHIDAVVGGRIPLLGRQIERSLKRRLLGRVFVAVASRVLGLRIFDTQCGAKLFRVTPEIRSVFGEAFLSRWIFDVEILARLILVQQAHPRRSSGVPVPEQRLFEFPLDSWREVSNSTLRGRDFRQAAVDLIRIYWRYSVKGWRPRLKQAPSAAVRGDLSRAA